MNRNNIWIHVGIAVVLVTLAAVLGQIDRWKTSLRAADTSVRHEVRNREVAQKAATATAAPEVLVRFKRGVSLEMARALAAKQNDAVADKIESVDGLAVIDDLDNADAQSVANHYSAMREFVEYAEVNYEISINAAEMPNDPLFSEQWALDNQGQGGGKRRADLDALEAWASTKGSEKVVVAVLDSGVDYRHEDLLGNMWQRPDSLPAYEDDELGAFDDINGYDGTAARDPMDDNGHGTHCAGIIGAEGDNAIGVSGINQTVQIMPLKFLGRGGFGSTNDAIEAINYAIDRKKNGVNLRIISASWGSTSKSKALEDTIRAAGDAGILFVAAAGNDGSDNDRRPHYPSNYDLPNVISVAALDRNDDLASFSNYGAKTVHIAAPGKEIVSTWLGGGYREASGTSMATPYVSGIAALIVASDPQISLRDLRARVIGSADGLDKLVGKIASGGRVCAANSLGNIVKHAH